MKENTGYPHIDKPWMKYYEGLYVPESDPKTNMVELLKERNKWRKNKTAYEYYGKEVSYDEMFHNADVASKVLTQVGVKKGDIIMNMVPNIPEEEELWFGATQIGAISDFIDPRPDSMDIMANAQALINVSRKRLCSKASPETRDAWKKVQDAVRNVDPVMADKMVPNCIYRGFCSELECCGYCQTQKFKEELEKYRNTDYGD